MSKVHLQSMTGFGKSVGTFNGKKVSIEIRALNSKGLDLNVRTHNFYRELDATIRKTVTDRLERGKVDVTVVIEEFGSQPAVRINPDLVVAYHRDLQKANELIGGKTEDYLALITRLPDVFSSEKEEVNAEEKEWILGLLHQACDQLQEFRLQEGASLLAEFQAQVGTIRRLLAETAPFEGERVAQIRARMLKQLEDIGASSYDDNRLEQELIFYLEKLDVSEEKVRLTNHLDYFELTMEKPSQGRKLGFICQEIGREINTLGSKCNHAEMQKKVVDMKDALEKMKEQVLNTL